MADHLSHPDSGKRVLERPHHRASPTVLGRAWAGEMACVLPWLLMQAGSGGLGGPKEIRGHPKEIRC